MKITHEDEIRRVREFNRELLLSILEADQLAEEKQNPTMNLKSQMLIRAALHTVDVLFRVSYKDQEPKGTAYAQHRNVLKSNFLHRFYESAEEEYNFIAARKVLIRAVRELDMEQEYDLLFVKRLNCGSVQDNDCYTITAAISPDTPLSYTVKNKKDPPAANHQS